MLQVDGTREVTFAPGSLRLLTTTRTQGEQERREGFEMGLGSDGDGLAWGVLVLT